MSIGSIDFKCWFVPRQKFFADLQPIVQLTYLRKYSPIPPCCFCAFCKFFLMFQ